MGCCSLRVMGIFEVTWEMWVLQGTHEQKCSRQTKIREVVAQHHTVLTLPTYQKEVEIIRKKF